MYFIGYAERSKGYRFYCPSHCTRIMESRNVKFFEHNLISGSDQSQDLVFVMDQPSTSSQRVFVRHQPSTSNQRLVIVHNTLKCNQMLNN